MIVLIYERGFSMRKGNDEINGVVGLVVKTYLCSHGNMPKTTGMKREFN